MDQTQKVIITETPRGVILTRPLALQLPEFLGDDTASSGRTRRSHSIPSQ